MNFEGLAIPGCYTPFGCPVTTNASYTTSRGAGISMPNFSSGKPAKPWLFPNLAAWYVINCDAAEYAGKDESSACSSGNLALYSAGKSPYDANIRPALGSDDYEGEYTISALDGLVVTPVRLPAGTKKAEFEIRGFKVGGGQKSYKAKLDLKTGTKSFTVTGLKAKGFVELKKIDFWLRADGKGGQAFAIDDLQLEEYTPSSLPASCTPTSTWTDTGKCKPTPTATTTFTADAEELTAGSALQRPEVYLDLNWNDRAYIRAVSGSASDISPALSLPSGNSLVYLSYSPLVITAPTVRQRFGVRSFDIACHFTEGTDGQDCKVTILGRRDPYDGDGLPNIVTRTVTLPNPGSAETQSLTSVDLGADFARLWYFSVAASIGGDLYSASIATDNIVFERQSGGKDCTANGLKTLNFNDLTPNTPIPSPYKTFFKFDSLIPESTTLGASSPPIALAVSPNQYPSITTFVSPLVNKLIDLHSLTLTVELPEGTTANDIDILIGGADACGANYASVYQFERNLVQYFYRRIGFTSGETGSVRIVFAEPMRAISGLNMQVYNRNNGEVPVKYWVDDLKYREFGGKLPGCRACGWRGTERCEGPSIPR